MISRLVARVLVASIVVLLAAITAAHAQTDVFWNAPTGTSGTWQLDSMWSTTAAGPNNYTWTNDGTERANFGNTGGIVTLGVPINTYGINFLVSGYTIAGGGNALTLTGP